MFNTNKWKKRYKILRQTYNDMTASYKLENQQLEALIARLQTKVRNQSKLIKKLREDNNVQKG